MPKPENKYDRRHLQFIQELLRQIDEIYKSATREAAAIGVSIGGFDSERPLDFKDYPLTARRVDRLVKQLGKALEVCMVNGVESEWTLANNKNNELAKRVFGKNVGRLTQAQYRRYFSNNDAAREAFVKRKENGLTLSDRVWKYTDEFKDEIEMGIDLGLRGGLSADQMARDLQQYLQHPDMLFRRVRDEHGILHLSKRAKDYHPGRGVYRSSYKNARRLAATECNTAYRTADHERWQQMDFVVGQEIHLSGNHTCKGKDGKPHKFEDMCDKLAGKYPKDFKFTGWHPHCRCYATSILKTDDEIAEDTRKMLAGEAVNGESVNRVRDVPEGFKTWVNENEGRMAKAKTLPGFLRENSGYVDASRKSKMALLHTEAVGVSDLTQKELNQLAGDVREVARKAGLFDKGLKADFSVFSDGTLMQWKDGGLSISTVRHRLEDGSVFCPAESLRSAIAKLKSGKTLEFLEEYSVECLFHESVHARATRIAEIIAGSMDEIIAETCTQLYARDRYVKILKVFKVEAVNFERIKTDGLGYNTECSKLRGFFTKGDELQVGELINIANETESGTKIVMKKLMRMGMREEDAENALMRLMYPTV